MKITDYGNSYVTWTGIVDKNDTRKPGHMPWPNTVRILLDSRCWITDDIGGSARVQHALAVPH